VHDDEIWSYLLEYVCMWQYLINFVPINKFGFESPAFLSVCTLEVILFVSEFNQIYTSFESISMNQDPVFNCYVYNL